MTHYYSVMVFYEDTDVAGVVYHANYLKFMERARTMFLQDHGLALTKMLETHGIQFAVHSMQIKYLKPAKLEQNLTIATKITKYGKARMVFSQDIYLGDDKQTSMCTAEVVVACIDLQMKPCAIPEAVLGVLKSES